MRFSKINHSPKSNSLAVVDYLFGFFKVKYTKSKLAKLFDEHFYSPSILAITDVLQKYGLASAAIKRDDHTLSDFETPFVCVIQHKEWKEPAFTVVVSIDSEVTYLDPVSEHLKKVSKEFFESIEKGVVLLIDGEYKIDEPEYSLNRKNERIEKLLKKIPIYSLAILFSSILIVQLRQDDTLLVNTVFLLTTALGVIISALLIWYEIGERSFVNQVCGGKTSKTDCNSVLTSGGSTVWGISWAVVGFSYFVCLFFSQILSGDQMLKATLGSCLAILASPYILYSVYYQAAIIKGWCLLCLIVQAVLAVNFIWAWAFFQNPFSVFVWNWYIVIVLILLAIIVVMGAFHVVRVLKEANTAKDKRKHLERLLYNQEVFYTLLEKGTKIVPPVEDLGIVIGNPDAKTEIVKVCNPYCGPCSEAHLDLMDIIAHNPDVKVRIIFTASGEKNDHLTPPVAHLFAIIEKYGIEKGIKALHEWQSLKEKDYVYLSSKYPIGGELDMQKSKLIAMRKWCDDVRIKATPTFFVNGKELPRGYWINELKNIYT